MTRRALIRGLVAVAATLGLLEFRSPFTREVYAMPPISIDSATVSGPGVEDAGTIQVQARTANGVKFSFYVNRTDPQIGPAATNLENLLKAKAKALLQAGIA